MKRDSAFLQQWLRGAALLVLAIILLAAMTVWFQSQFEKKPVFVPVSDLSSQERHAFAAAAAYLRESGHQVSIRRDMRLFSALPEPGNMLILLNLPGNARGELWPALSAWMAQGGHLVLAPGLEPVAGEKALLDRLGVQVSASEERETCGEDDAEAACKQADKANRAVLDPDQAIVFHGTLEGYPVRLAIDGAPPRLGLRAPHQAELRLQGVLEQPVESPDSNRETSGHVPLPSRFLPAQADWLQRHAFGAGSLTLLSSMRPLTEDMLAQEDNAFLLSAITRGHGKIWLWLPGRTESLFKLLLKSSPLFLASLALMLIALLFSQQARLQPPLVPVRENRRDVLSYFDGAGRFAWRLNRAAGLIRENREALAQELKRHRNLTRENESGSATAARQGKTASASISADEQLALHGKLRNSQDLIRVSNAMLRLRHTLRRTP